MIYLDNAATTAVDKEILTSYFALLNEQFANPSSIHKAGQDSFRLLSKAREQILQLFQLTDHEIVFTSGATEAINLALKGYAIANATRGNHLITSSVEHPAVLNAMIQLRDYFHFDLTILPVDADGIIQPQSVQKAIRDDTILVAIMQVNNETGSIMPIDEISKIVKQHPKAVFFSDTTQGIGKINAHYDDLDMFVVSAHKINGLKVSGALIKRKSIKIIPLASGGGQENNLRSGTSDFPIHVMLSKTIRMALEKLKGHSEHAKELTDYLRNELIKRDELVINSPVSASPFIVNFSLKTKKASVVIEALSLKQIMVSSVSACSSNKFVGSSVLFADHIMIHFGELSTKGKNKKNFIRMLSKNVRHALKNTANLTYVATNDHIYIRLNENDYEPIMRRLQDVSGIQSLSLVLKTNAEFENLKNVCLELMQNENGNTFKVKTRRADKSYPLISDTVNREIGAFILTHTDWKVDVHEPDIILTIDIRREAAYVYAKTIPGAGGYPLGVGGKVLTMITRSDL
ncbi:MAG: aminotransferase class V-fold PLP-dependent enzyme [Firmicutes bacterium]|nr:aminotransferase class V-fold PLP-dependent enzyme [Bacillota bacterium]